MTIEEVRKLMGKEIENVCDEELEGNIKAAELLKNLFFEYKKFG